MDTQTFLAIGLVLWFSSMLQSAVGFAFGLFAVPLMLWLGLHPQDVVALVVGAALFQSAFGVYHLRRHVPWRRIVLPVVSAAVTLPLGVLALSVVAGLETTVVRQLFGLVLLLLLPLIGRATPKEALHPGWAVLAGASSGLLGGMSGMGGPPLVLWVIAHDWSSHEIRAAILAQIVVRIPIQVALMAFVFGTEILWPMLVGLAFLPVVLVGSAIGLWIGHHISGQVLRRIAVLLLALIGIVSIAAPVLYRDG
jgi:uncharacterized membrane protein YfcA